MAKKVLKKRTSRGAVEPKSVLKRNSMLRYAGNSVERVRRLQDNPDFFRYGYYERPGAPTLQDATARAEKAMSEGRLREAMQFACDISEVLLTIPHSEKEYGGSRHEEATRAHEVAEGIVEAFKRKLGHAAK